MAVANSHFVTVAFNNVFASQVLAVLLESMAAQPLMYVLPHGAVGMACAQRAILVAISLSNIVRASASLVGLDLSVIEAHAFQILEIAVVMGGAYLLATVGQGASATQDTLGPNARQHAWGFARGTMGSTLLGAVVVPCKMMTLWTESVVVRMGGVGKLKPAQVHPSK